MFKENPTPESLKKKMIQLEEYIKHNIPLTNFINFNITELTHDSIRITAPLKPNDNHYGTVFGGSLAILGILAGWGLLHFNMIEDSIKGTLVIQEGKMKFLRPALTNFEAVNRALTPKIWNDFKLDFIEKGKAKIKIKSQLYSAGKLVAIHEGLYVAISKPIKQ
ncbi:MAG: YiiD C-terminal domain-containing protein [Melioribacteraceae bacterium]|nr:YiiD C-terminal domain-containing protein [Melioribacteraceae bacterium]